MSRIPSATENASDSVRNEIYENLPCQAMYNESVRKIKVANELTALNHHPQQQQQQHHHHHNNHNQLLHNNIAAVLNNCNQSSGNGNGVSVKKAQLPKEYLYATPLRKSDRYKSGERININSSGCSSSGGSMNNRNNKLSIALIPNNISTDVNSIGLERCNEKLYNVEHKLINKDNNIYLKNSNNRTNNVGDSGSSEMAIKRMVGTGGLPPTGLIMKNCTQSQVNNLEDRRILNFLKQAQKKIEISGKDCPNSSFSCLAREEHFANLVQQNFTGSDCIISPATTATNNVNSNYSKQKEVDDGENLLMCHDAIDSASAVVSAAKMNGDDGDSQITTNNDVTNQLHVEETTENLEVFMSKKQSPDKEVNGIIVPGGKHRQPQPSSSAANIAIKSMQPTNINSVYINREWVLKKIALCLEQRISGKKIVPVPGGGVALKGDMFLKELSNVNNAAALLPRPSHHHHHHHSSSMSSGSASVVGGNSSYHGCLILGSNGSGKTSICEAIMNGNIGTRGLLNRKLLACYFLNSQNPDCHSLSAFIRNVVLQILSHSSVINRQDIKEFSPEEKNNQNIDAKPNLPFNTSIDDNNEELLIEQLKRDAPDAFITKEETDSNDKKIIIRQKSAPSPEKKIDNDIAFASLPYSTHPPKLVTIGKSQSEENESQLKLKDASTVDDNTNKAKSSPGKKSKIPISITCRIPKQSNNDIQQGGGEDSATDLVGEELKSEIEAEINDDIGVDDDDDEEEKIAQTESQRDEIAAAAAATTEEEEVTESLKRETSNNSSSQQQQITNLNQKTTSPENQSDAQIPSPSTEQQQLPPPLPKPKSCRTIIADSYYEMLISNPEILECLNVDTIEKNPDECFKKAILFPLLELTVPRNALLLLIDSIDENYVSGEGNLISTLKGAGKSAASTEKSRNIAELLSNHIHLFPKWLFVVCTTKKQTKHITKMFNGFKKITLDDLRKSHVVKDVQEYIINRLNTDFKGAINLTKEIIESLHQLYIKSNGCILYLEKVLDGIKENFFTFREIKLIPCTLNGLYLYICQKSFNKKQYLKIRPILNVLLASTIEFVDKLFLFNCLRTHNYTIDYNEFEKRLDLIKNIVTYDESGKKLKIFHNSFADWLCDVKFATKKFICNVNEGHIMISMYFTLISDTLCPNNVRRFIYHLIKSGEYLTSKSINLDLILMLLESKINLNDCFYTNLLNCCTQCELEYKQDAKFFSKTRMMIDKFLSNELNDDFSTFLCDFFKPNLPTDGKILKLLIETGINNVNSQASCDSLNSLNSPESSEKSQNIDFELANLLLSSEKNCQQEIQQQQQRPKSSSERSGDSHSHSRHQIESQDENSSALHQISDSHRIEMHKGKALIHILANEGNHILLSRALNACKGPIDLEIEDYNGQTALNIAARNGHLEVVKLLLNFTQPLNDGTGRMRQIDVNHADRDGWTPLRSASWGGHTEVVKMLIAHPGCLIDLADKEGRTALRAAAWSGHEDILKLLIEAGADVNSVDRQGRTSLIAASYMGHYDIVEILLENGAHVNHLDFDGRSALCVAALCGSSGYSKVISTLLEHGANTDQLDHDGMSPLLVSSFEGNAEVCELLLENGADPDLTDFMGRTPLWAACTAGHANVVRLLLFWGCGIDCMDSEGRTVLSIAAAQGNVETVRQLLDRGLDETHRDNAGWTPLHYAAFEGFHEVCMQLLESGAKIDECDNEGKTALHLAAQEGRQKCIQTLLEIHSAFVDQKAHDGKTAFRLACLEGYIDCAQTLLKFGCDVNCKDADSRTTLYILALENKLEVVKYLLDVTNVDVNIPDTEGRTALHVAAWQGHTEMVKLLITKGNADVNAMDLECRTPLHSCAWQGNHEVMEILLYFGAIPDHACKQGATALGISAQEGHDKCVTILLKYGANPFKSDHCGRTPIKLAAKSNRTNIIKIFESYAKTNESNVEQKLHLHSNVLRSPDDIPSVDRTQQQAFLVSSHGHSNHHQQQHHLMPNNNNILVSGGGVGGGSSKILNASTSTHSSNFYENTMQSDNSSLQKRKSVISSQSTGSSNEAPLSFTQQLQRHTKLNSRNNPFIQNTPVISTKHPSKHQQQKHSQLLPDLNEYQTNSAIVNNVATNDADLFDMECMSPLYATPPHSPSSELSSPGQLSSTHPSFEEMGIAIQQNQQKSGQPTSSSTDNHFARDTHMRVILGNCNKESNNPPSGKSKRSGIATNPAMRMIRSRFDSAANLIRRTNNILNITSNSNQGSSSIGVKSSTFQWRKESQM